MRSLIFVALLIPALAIAAPKKKHHVVKIQGTAAGVAKAPAVVPLSGKATATSSVR